MVLFSSVVVIVLAFVFARAIAAASSARHLTQLGEASLPASARLIAPPLVFAAGSQ